MQAVSETYTRLLNTPGTIKQHKAVINGVEYDEEQIVGAPMTQNSLFGREEGPAIGQVNAAEIDISILPQGEVIPRRAEIRLFTRLAAVDYVAEVITEHSEWLQKGVFYIDTRQPDAVTGVLTIHGYDAILLHGGEAYLAEGDVGTWPRAADVVVADLAKRFGLELDERTVIDPSVLVPYPNDWTCRELLGYIGAAHGGNWTVTDAGKLRLVPLWSVPDETFYLVDENGDYITFGGDRIAFGKGAENPNDSGTQSTHIGKNVEQYGAPEPFEPFSRVVVWYDDENAFTAGDDTGRTLEVDCPIASQAIAEKILASVKGYAYQPYEAERAVLDPAAELGDGVTANGVYSVLARIETTFNALMVSDIAAPADEEIDHEMPYESQTQLALKRKLTLGRNYYGVQVTKNAGWEVVKYNSEGEEIKRARFNADELAMYDDQGNPRIYFDTNTARYKYVGDLDITGGNINLSGGSIIWGDNKPASGISASQAKTLINEQLVSSPTIAGAKFYSRNEDGSLGSTWVEIGTEGGPGAGYGLLLKASGFISNPVFGVYNGDFNSTAFSAKGFSFMGTDADDETVTPFGKWDFSNADVDLSVPGSLPLAAGNGRVAMRLDPDNDRINFYVGGKTWVLTADGFSEL